jgi:hypothetical protein
VLISRFLVDSAVVLSTSSTASEASFTDISIGLSSVVASIAIGILLMVVSAYRPLKRASKVDAAEALTYIHVISAEGTAPMCGPSFGWPLATGWQLAQIPNDLPRRAREASSSEREATSGAPTWHQTHVSVFGWPASSWSWALKGR